jgi:uncharacterized protein YggU (UPF0235/DUF167 family)
VIRLVARALDVPPRSVELVAGTHARRKRLRVTSLSDQDLARRLARLSAD